MRNRRAVQCPRFLRATTPLSAAINFAKLASVRRRNLTAMKCVHVSITAFAGALLIAPGQIDAADWPQWRGPHRNGVAPDGPRLLEAFPKEGLRPIWESESIPSNDEGGLGSIVVHDQCAYLSVVWHRDVPTETRQIDDLVLRQLGYQPVDSLPPAVVTKMERDRETLAPQLRGKKFDEFAAQWVAENLDKKQQQLFAGYITNRLRKGPLAIPLDAFEKLNAHQHYVFATDAEMRAWLRAQQFSEEVQRQVIAAVPPTRRVADDTVVCLDLETGRTLWKTQVPGEPTGRNSSSTPCIAEGHVFALGSTQAHCVDAKTGTTRWSAALPAKGPGSSPLYLPGAVVINAGKLVALDPHTGNLLWTQPKAGGTNSSPVAWKSEDRTIVLCNSRKDLVAVDAKSGELIWSVPAGGDSTPAILNNQLAVQGRPELGLLLYDLKPDAPAKRWNVPMDVLRNQSSPLIHEQAVYLVDDDMQRCFDLATGGKRWEEKVSSSISSPVLADGKLFIMINNGNNVQMLQANGEKRAELGRAVVRGTWVPSLAIANGRLLVRTKDNVRCYDLRIGNTAETPAAAAN
jgi:outer membrane protein assembly factor BamB